MRSAPVPVRHYHRGRNEAVVARSSVREWWSLMDICVLAAVDKRFLARKVGDDLAKRHGRQAQYAVQDIKASVRRLNFPDAWDCWALSLYASPQDFVDYHVRTGEQCGHAAMRASMMEAVAADAHAVSFDPSPIDAAPLGHAVDASPSHDASWLDGVSDWLGGADPSDA